MHPNVIPKNINFGEGSPGEVSAGVSSSQVSGPTPAPNETKAHPTRSRTTWTLFEEPYWLDSVAPGAWHAVEISRDGRVIARLPYVVRKLYGVTALTLPPLTPSLGPWMAPSDGGYAKQLGAQHELLRELVGQLPKAARVLISCAPEFTNLHALNSEGYTLGLMYTYRLEDLSSLDAIWKEFSRAIKGRCKHARKHVEVATGPDLLPKVIHSISKTFERQNLGSKVRPLAATLERIDSALGKRGQCRSFAAIDAKGRTHAALFLVFDERHAFVLAGGQDAELRASGAYSLLMWEAIQFAATHSRIFDFEGSMIPSVERYVRNFGPRQVPVYSALKESWLLSSTQGSLGSMARRAWGALEMIRVRRRAAESGEKKAF